MTGRETVEPPAGALEGVRSGAVTAWRGIPYARAPEGPRRFRAPEPPRTWAGVRPAHRYGGAAPQSGLLSGPARHLGSQLSEDCLYLNVWAPATAPVDARPRPVLVWIHGGAFKSGSGALYDGAALAELGDILVVTVNYRLGVLGFVNFAAALESDIPSNLGLRDQIAALQWVRDNIAAFGGDPERVTVAGESAGSISVSLLSCAPAAAGLFRAGIMQSGSYSLIHGPETSEEIARSYARRLGLGPRDGHRLRELPVEELSAAQRYVDRITPGTVPGAPWFDGDVVPSSLEDARRAVRPDLALLAGHNRDEVTFFQRTPGDVVPTRRLDLENRLRAALGWEAADRLLEHYPDSPAGTRALGSDLNFALPTLHFAERQSAAGGPSYFYRLDAVVPVLGATHAVDLVYLWDWSGWNAFVLRGRRTAGRAALARRMQQHWVTFVRDGAPGPGWPAFTLPERAVQVFSPAGDRIERDPSADRRLAWAGRDVLSRT